MRPPVLAQALVAAVAPASDYEIVAGDLHEEYVGIASSRGEKAADRWYWGQVLLSIPSLLSYSRLHRSALGYLGVALTALAVLCAMFVALATLDTVMPKLVGTEMPDWVWFCINYAVALVFGAILALLVPTEGVRVTFWASVFLVLCFVVPALAGNPHSQAPLGTWLHLFGAIPVMCLGAGLSQSLRRRVVNQN
jgi:hypothetical protein